MRLILGGPFGSEPAEASFERLTHFADAGGRLIETSRSYARGTAEEPVGRWLRKNPGALGVVTKVGHDLTGRDIPLSRENVHAEVRTSLDCLGIEAIDVLLLHCDDPARPVEELAETLLSLVAAGYVQRVGVSNWPSDRLAQLANLLHERGQQVTASYQYSLATPDPTRLGGSLHADDAVLDVVRAQELLLFSWSSQARGFFARTGPKADDDKPDPYESEENRTRRTRCRTLAEELGSQPETVALAWLLHHPDVRPSIGPKTIAQIDRARSALDLNLTDQQADWLERGQS